MTHIQRYNEDYIITKLLLRPGRPVWTCFLAFKIRLLLKSHLRIFWLTLIFIVFSYTGLIEYILSFASVTHNQLTFLLMCVSRNMTGRWQSNASTKRIWLSPRLCWGKRSKYSRWVRICWKYKYPIVWVIIMENNIKQSGWFSLDTDTKELPWCLFHSNCSHTWGLTGSLNSWKHIEKKKKKINKLEYSTQVLYLAPQCIDRLMASYFCWVHRLNDKSMSCNILFSKLLKQL